MKKSLPALLLFVVLTPHLFCQSVNDTLDSIEKSNKPDTVKILLRAAVGEGIPILRIGFWDSIRVNAEKWDMKKTVSQCLNNIGYVYDCLGDVQTGIEYYNQALKLREEISDKKGIAETLTNISLVYERIGDVVNALDAQFKALKIQEEIADIPGMALSANNIGHIYVDQNDIPKALEYYNRCLQLSEGVSRDLSATAINNIGNLHRLMAFKKGTDEKAWDSLLTVSEEHFKRALEVHREINDAPGIGTVLQNLGMIRVDRKDYAGARKYYDESMAIWEKDGNKDGSAYILYSIGNLYLRERKFAMAQNYGLKALKLSRELGYPFHIRQSADLLKNAYREQDKWKEAYEMLDLYHLMSDSLNSETNRKASMQKEFQYEYEKKEALLKAEQEKEMAVAQERSRKQKIIIRSIIAGLLLAVVFAVFIFRSLQLTRKQKKIIEIKNAETELQKRIIEEKNKNITDSITYAKRIQQAKLPVKEDIHSLFPHSFILFKPKDIVSGDFYFFRKVNGTKVLAAADCTGHGVPGAFMSLIGSEKLEEAVSASTDASYILKHLNNGIRTSLHQSDSSESTRDGMDIALCTVDGSNKFRFAGANRPAWIVRKGIKEVEEVSPTKSAIGGYTESDQHFGSHEFELLPGDTLYLFSDGYADTYSSDGKKLKSKKFRELLLEIQDRSMKDQEQFLDQFIESWKNGAEQVDDILVIGVRM